MTTPGQTRPEPMNASPNHSKVKVSLTLSDPLFVAGGHITGKVELECRVEKDLGIGIIMVELFAIQELISRDHSATSTFMHLVRRFQGPTLPPSNAVYPYPAPGSEPLPAHHYPARKGATTFFFQFPLPPSSPSSIDFGKGLAKLKYEVKASVGVGWKGERRLVTDKKDVDVVESHDEQTRESGEKVVIGENGKFWAQARVINSVLVAGQPACVELHVKNHSSKKSTSLTLTFTRQLHLTSLSQHNNAAPVESLQISDTLATVPYRGPEYLVHSGTEGIANLVFDVPRNARGVVGGLRDGGEEGVNNRIAEGERSGRYVESLFEVRCTISIKIAMGIGNKDIQVDIPVTVVHPATLPAGPVPDPYILPTRITSPLPPHPAQSPQPQYFPPHSYLYPYPPTSPPAPFSPVQSPPINYPYSPAPVYNNPSDPYWIPHNSSPGGYLIHNPVHIGNPGQPTYYIPPPLPVNEILQRSISADAYVSQPLLGFPTPSSEVHHHLQAYVQPQYEPNEALEEEEGKGDRASRVTAHLRMTSRNRSVSPQSHRYPYLAAQTLPGHSTPTSGDLLSVHTQRHSTGPNGPLVLSPRPMLSPKASSHHDPVTNRTITKSKSVEHLEKWVADQEKEGQLKSEAGAEETRFLMAPDSTVKSPTYTEDNGLLSVEDILRKNESMELPPQPVLTPAKSQKSWHLGREGGLDALERKLLDQVGTRKPEAGKRADIRSIMPISLPSPSAPLPPAASTDDSGISSLILSENIKPPDVNKRKSFHSHGDNETYMDESDATRGADKKIEAETKRLSERGSKEKGKEKEQEKRKHTETRWFKKTAAGRIAAWLDGITSARDESSGNRPEQFLESPVVEASSPVSPPVPPKDTDPRHKESEDSSAPIRSSGFILHATVKGDPEFEKAVQKVLDLEKAENDTSGTTKKPTVKEALIAGPDKRVGINSIDWDPKSKAAGINADVTRLEARLFPKAKLLPSPAKYDIRSARGGRGGQVSMLASMWAEAAQMDNDATKIKPALSDKQPAALSAGHFKPWTAEPKPSAPTLFSSTAGELTSRRAKMVKSSSVPAIVSSSLAKPELSSTASLARPADNHNRNRPKPRVMSSLPTVAEADTQAKPSSSRPGPRGDIAFGQARLKELLKKYERGT